MFWFDFKFNTELLSDPKLFIQNHISFLKEVSDKTFSVDIDNTIYNLRYEVDDSGKVDLFLLTDDVSDSELIVPKLELNIGNLLLPTLVPESINLDISENIPSGYNPTVENYETVVLGTQEISENTIKKIKDYVKQTGLQNLLKKKNSLNT